MPPMVVSRQSKPISVKLHSKSRDEVQTLAINKESGDHVFKHQLRVTRHVQVTVRTNLIMKILECTGALTPWNRVPGNKPSKVSG